jgi:hypothetical protein
VRFVVLACLVIGCTPDLEGTAFRCDDQHACPADQTCLFGRCRRHPAVSIGCGTASCDGSQQCCVDGTNPPRCIPAKDVCPSGREALCDGIDDCAFGERCCNAVVTACGLDCDEFACAADLDCPSEEPHCCPQSELPWGQCQLDDC